MNSTTYILDGKTPVATDLMTWANAFGLQDRHVARTAKGNVSVSTVFLGIDHNFGGDGPPLLFETTLLPKGRWHFDGRTVHPSVMCADCGFHMMIEKTNDAEPEAFL